MTRCACILNFKICMQAYIKISQNRRHTPARVTRSRMGRRRRRPTTAETRPENRRALGVVSAEPPKRTRATCPVVRTTVVTIPIRCSSAATAFTGCMCCPIGEVSRACGCGSSVGRRVSTRACRCASADPATRRRTIWSKWERMATKRSCCTG